MNIKSILFIISIVALLFSCMTPKKVSHKTVENQEKVVISNDSLEYEIIILDIGFNTFLQSMAQPKWYYSEEYYKTKNVFYVTEWNLRVLNPNSYFPDIYEQRIDYDSTIDYGLEVNYLLYNYFKFIEFKYKIKF